MQAIQARQAVTSSQKQFSARNVVALERKDPRRTGVGANNHNEKLLCGSLVINMMRCQPLATFQWQ